MRSTVCAGVLVLERVKLGLSLILLIIVAFLGCTAPRGRAVVTKAPKSATAPAPVAAQQDSGTSAVPKSSQSSDSGQKIPAAQPVFSPGSAARRPSVAGTPSGTVRSQAVPSAAAQALISQVDAEYEAGTKAYRTDNLDQARQHFDHALSLMLESDLDVQSDPQLEAEFSKVVENTYGVELAAIERGDSLSEQKYEAPPIEAFAGLTFPVDPKVKERVQQEVRSVRSDLPLVSNDYVDGVITYLQNHGRGYISTVVHRCGLYQPLISETLRKEGLPQDLLYLAAGESSCNPYALSRKGAKGIWQFMVGTGELYGLRKNQWVDEREDPVKSTRAAARHLKDLYKQFGDWFLAMAAYDWNPDGVQHAIERTGYADYWMLRKLNALPKETENYVPIFLATALIAKDPKAYGFDLTPDPPLDPDQVTVSTPTDLRLVAELIDRPLEDLVRLNPSLLRGVTPANDPHFVINLPAGTSKALEKEFARVPPEKRRWWRAHRVEPGDTLASIARGFHISTVSLAEANSLSGNDSLETGAHLLVPLASRSSDLGSQRGARRLYHYKVRPGDTLELIADRFEVPSYEIRRWNNLRSSRVRPGHVLKVYAHVRQSRSPSRTSGRRHRTSTHTAGKTSRKSQVVQSSHPPGATGTAKPHKRRQRRHSSASGPVASR